MIAIKNGYRFIFNNFFNNCVIMLLIIISSVLLFFSAINYELINHQYDAVKPLLNKGIFYLSSFEHSFNSLNKEDIENCEEIYKIYEHNFVSNNELNKFYAYDNELIEIYNKYLISGRLPNTASETVEVLAMDGVNKVGDKLSISIPYNGEMGEEFQVEVVGTLSSETYILVANTAGDSGLYLSDILEQSSMNSLNYYIGISDQFLAKQPNIINHIFIYIKYPLDYYNTNKTEISFNLNNYGNAYSIDEIYEHTKKADKEELLFALVILIISFIAGISLITINLILLFNKNIMKLTVLYINGFSIKTINQMLIFYILLILLFSYIISYLIIISYIPYAYPFGIGFNINLLDYLKPLIIGFIMMLTSFLTIYKYLRNNRLIENINKSI